MIQHFFSIFRSSQTTRDNILDWPDEDAADFEFYRDFFLENQAADLLEVLKKENIPYQFEEVKYVIDPVIVGQALKPKFVLKIRAIDFERANKIWEEVIRQHPAIESDHYLHDFSTQELLAIVNNPTSWSLEDVVLAKMLLEKGGIIIDDAYLKEKEEARIQKLKEGKEPSNIWMSLYFVMALTGPFLHVILTMASLGMGWYYWKDTTVSPKGEKFPTFSENGRKLGQWLFFTSWLALGAFVAFMFFVR
ncbi:MAG: hypothetical protein R2784_04970 [Saprospiraceae bacterium]